MEQGLLFEPHNTAQKSAAQNAAHVFSGSHSYALKKHFISYLLKAVSQKETDHKHYILVHSNLLANHLKHTLIQHNIPSRALHFITFFDCAKIILNSFNMSIDKPVLDKNLSLLKLGQLCQDFFKHDVPNSSLAFLDNKTAFVDKLLQSYAYLEKQGVNQWPNAHEDLSALHEKYKKEFCAQYFTQDTFLLHVANLLSTQTSSLPKLQDQLYVYGFYDFSPIQQQLIKHAPFSQKTLWLLSDSSAQNSMDDLNCVSIEDDKAHSDKVISVHPCINETQELEHLKDFLFKQVNDNAKTLNSTAVLVPNPHYLNQCKLMFEQQHIPYYAPVGTTVSDSVLGKILNLVLNYRESQKTQKDIVKLILDFPLQNKSFDQKQILQFIDEQHIFNEAMLIKAKTCPEILKHFLVAINTLFDQSQSYSQFFNHWVQFLKTYIEDRCLVQQLEHTLLFNLKKHLKQLETLNFSFNLKYLSSAIHQFLNLKHESSNSKKMHQSGVYLAPMDYAAFLDFDSIYILGLNQNAFPKADQLINLLTIEKHSLDKTPILYHHDKDIHLFKQMVSGPANINLFYSRYDQLNDQDLQKSLVFDYLESFELKEHVHQTKSAQSNFTSLLDYQKNILSHDLRAIDKSNSQNFGTNLKLMPQQLAWAESNLKPNPKFDAYSGKLTPSEDRKNMFSVTALQRYATCPYQYFLNDQLKLKSKAWSNDIYGLHPMEKGELLHEILFLFYQKWIIDPKVSFEQKETWLKDIFETVHQKHYRFTLKHKELWPLEQLNLFQRIKSFISHEHHHSNNFYPLALEMRFGAFKSEQEDQRYSQDNPLCLEYKGQKLYFRGKIDRVDMHTDQKHLRVIDYKSGKLSAKNDDFAGGKTIQLAVYLLICQQQFPNIPLSQMQASMISIDPKQNFSEKHLSGTYLEQNLDDFHQLIFSLSDGIHSGLFYQNPGSNSTHCQTCDYTSICQSSVAKKSKLVQNNSDLIPIGVNNE